MPPLAKSAVGSRLPGNQCLLPPPRPTPLQLHSLVCVVTAGLNSLSPGRLLGPFFLLGETGSSDVQVCSPGAQTRWCPLEVVADPSVGWTASSPDPRVPVPGSPSTLVHLGWRGRAPPRRVPTPSPGRAFRLLTEPSLRQAR